jgi:hypothetical protein
MAREYEGAHRIGANSRLGTRRDTRARSCADASSCWRSGTSGGWWLTGVGRPLRSRERGRRDARIRIPSGRELCAGGDARIRKRSSQRVRRAPCRPLLRFVQSISGRLRRANLAAPAFSRRRPCGPVVARSPARTTRRARARRRSAVRGSRRRQRVRGMSSAEGEPGAHCGESERRGCDCGQRQEAGVSPDGVTGPGSWDGRGSR